MIRARALERSPGANQVLVLQRELDRRQLRTRDVLNTPRHQLVAALPRLIAHVLREHAGDGDGRTRERLADDRLDARVDAHCERHPVGVGQCVVGSAGKFRVASRINLHLGGDHERALERLHRGGVIPLHEIELGRLRQSIVTAHNLYQMHGITGIWHELKKAVIMAQRPGDTHLVSSFWMARFAATEVDRDPSRVVLKIEHRVAAACHVRVGSDDALGGENRLGVGRLAVVIHQRAQILDGDRVAAG